jgi:type II secretory pathway component PulF
MRFISSLFRPRISLEQLSRFSGNLATCIAAGLDIPKSLTTCQRNAPSPLLREILTSAAKQAASGKQLFEALKPHSRSFPAFFLPAVRCGEESGRLDETLRYLENHCRLLVGPARMMRNMWFAPLCLLLADTVICTVAYCFIAPWAMTFAYILEWLKFYTILAAAVAAVVYVPPLRELAEAIRLLVPVIGPAERELTMNRFFHAMNVLYSTGGRRVEEMIRLAADSAENLALRADLVRAAELIESGDSIGEAFSAVACIPLTYRATITAGEEAGKLEDAFDSICRESSEAVISLLAAFQPLYFRVIGGMVIMSIIGTFLSLSALRH